MNLNGIMIGSADPKALADYYGKLFGAPGFEESGYTGWMIGNSYLTIGPHDGVSGRSPQPGRLMWCIETPDVEAEFTRLTGLGAQVVQEPYHPGDDGRMSVATLEDPDGNYFQLMSPMPTE
jgi:predicted enzyme related to lactoylglutathione lyase